MIGRRSVALVVASVLLVLLLGSSASSAAGPSAGQCVETFPLEFDPPVSLIPGSGTFETPAPGTVECRGTLNGQDITGTGTFEIEGTYGDLATAPLGGDSCQLGNFTVMPRLVVRNRYGRKVRLNGQGTSYRVGSAGAIKGAFNGVPVTALFASQAEPGEDCSQGARFFRVTIIRLIGV